MWVAMAILLCGPHFNLGPFVGRVATDEWQLSGILLGLGLGLSGNNLLGRLRVLALEGDSLVGRLWGLTLMGEHCDVCKHRRQWWQWCL